MNLLIPPQPTAALFQLALIELAVTEGMEIEHFDWEEAKYLIRANGADNELKAEVAHQAVIAEHYLAKQFTARNQIYQITDNSLIVS
jgi:anaerobic ribonucleoside-triphosphate reductase